MPHITARTAQATSASPGTSTGVARPAPSGTFTSTSGTSTSPIGTFSQKIASQPISCVTIPPSTGPVRTAIPAPASRRPIAAPRRSAGYAALTRASPSAMTSAAPAPCPARPATSTPASGASPQTADEAVNTDSPIAYMRRRPNRSPSAAAGSSRTATARL